MCGFFDVSVAKFGEMEELITSSENVRPAGGRVRRIRFQRSTPDCRIRLFVSGGLSLGRSVRTPAYALTIAACCSRQRAPRAEPFCDVRPPMQPNVKASGRVPVALVGTSRPAATFQSLPGPQILAQQRRPTRRSGDRSAATCHRVAPPRSATTPALLDLLPPVRCTATASTRSTSGSTRRSGSAGQSFVHRCPSITFSTRTRCFSTAIATRSIVAGADGHPDRAIRGRRRAGGFLRRRRSARVWSCPRDRASTRGAAAS